MHSGSEEDHNCSMEPRRYRHLHFLDSPEYPAKKAVMGLKENKFYN